MRKIGLLVGMMLIMMVSAFAAGAGTLAIFRDTEQAGQNTFTAGTLDLKVNDEDDPLVHVELPNMKPGDKVCLRWELKNTGSIPGQPSVEFSTITNNENGMNEPESDAEDEDYASEEGELGQYLKTCTGYAPCSWSECTISKHLYCNWQTGPAHPWGTPGLNGLGGETLTGLPVLDQGETICFLMNMELEDDLRAWDGCGWYDVDDNIIQSDSVEFEIIFHLEQAE